MMIKLTAALSLGLTAAGIVLIALAAVGAMPSQGAWAGFLVIGWGQIAFIEFRLELHGERLAEQLVKRELAAYELGRLRGLP